ncbi:protein mono-ADP-ribosyltransferase PARP15-like [Rana temporaria]|uniref:protein mono-ADP-ribosyltransferase PARP15-like n=1 Tax=Rana temporaria TaxID=8407 RepID=UPI001AAD68B8|nr:protein mono-ADP-ribosyltransferase PARP15-like [Rana temporaria]
MGEVVVGETPVEIILGDITAETTDAIVIPNNATLNQDYGVSKHILASAGTAVKEECARLCKLPNDGCVVTGAGNLKSKIIIHLIDVKPEHITPYLKKSFKACEQRHFHSISIPAIGTGSGNLDPQNSIKAILRAIEEHLINPDDQVESTTVSSVSRIRIVVFDLAVYQEYLKFYQTYKINYSHFTAFGKTIELVKGDITDQPVDCIVNLANRTLDQKIGVSKAILAAAGKVVEEECKRIGKLRGSEVAITSGGNTKSKHIMHIIGPGAIPAFEPSVDRILKACHLRQFKSVAIVAIGTGINKIDPEESIKAILNSTVKHLSEIALPTLEIISIVVIQEEVYRPYLKVFLQHCTEMQEWKREEHILRAINAKVIIPYPKTWTNSGKTEYEEIILDKSSAEFKEVEKKFLQTSGRLLRVVQVARIQNKKLWQSFSLNKQTVDQNNPGVDNVKHLYHGTAFENIHNITHGGFNRIYCGKNGTYNGLGTYFAVRSDYSCHDKYSAPDLDGCKRVFQTAVITGKYCKGDKSLREPPYVNEQTKDRRYDSVVDNMQKITYFVVFHDDHAYPEYLITFKP